jgi:hypothetical protein
MSHRKQYEVGIMQTLPWSENEDARTDELVQRAHESILSIRAMDESSRFFVGTHTDVDKHLDTAVKTLWELDMVVAGEYGVDARELLLKGSTKTEKMQAAGVDVRRALKLAGGFPDKKTAMHNRISYAVGCAFGRWDMRYALGVKTAPEPPGLFDPLPVCSPGMLTGDDGLPASTAPDEYPIEIQWDGILVDDAGIDSNHPKSNDIVRRIQEVWRTLHGDNAENTEQQICQILKLDDLRNYFRGACPFFERHQKAYRKGGRDAPIYWPLATRSGAYTLWIYYPRLTDQTLYTAEDKYVSPKINEIQRRIVQIDEKLNETSGREATDLRDERESCKSLLSELEAFRDELLRIAALPYQPNLNDGVMICAAPLWELIAHNAWSKKLKTCWKALSDGEYEWAHLAFSIWPDRIRTAAEDDLSIAIAHGLATGSELYDDESVVDEADAEMLDDEDGDDEGDDDE